MGPWLRARVRRFSADSVVVQVMLERVGGAGAAPTAATDPSASTAAATAAPEEAPQ